MDTQNNIHTVNTFPELPSQKTAGIYARISTSRHGQPLSLQNQIEGLVTYVSRNPQLKLGGIYSDIGSGRSVESRRELNRLAEDCRKGTIQAVVTKSLSRFGRNTAATLDLCRKLKDLGVDVYFQNEDIHTLSPDGELTMTLIMAIDEGTSYTRSEAVKWGIERRAADPDAAIYSRPCYGYRLDAEGQLVIQEEEAQVVRDIYQMYLGGAGSRAIQKELQVKGIPSPSGSAVWPKRTIEKMLRNEKYCGDVILYKTYTDEFPSTRRIVNNGQREKLTVQNHHPAILTKEVFEAVQSCIQSRMTSREASS